MITGGTIDYVEAKRDKEDNIAGIGIDIQIQEVSVNGKNVKLKYTYIVKYESGVGTLKMSGTLSAEEEPKKAKEIDDTYKKTKKLPDDFAEVVLNSINFTCGTNGIFVIRPLNLTPPMVPPRIEISKAPAKPSPAS
ncbi:hypothetical protein FJZ26_01715 [Candidatus Parvarchaeota archaeon]|nr:hypothetical protein [Candidatus Parvarchaeota archaeon]